MRHGSLRRTLRGTARAARTLVAALAASLLCAFPAPQALSEPIATEILTRPRPRPEQPVQFPPAKPRHTDTGMALQPSGEGPIIRIGVQQTISHYSRPRDQNLVRRSLDAVRKAFAENRIEVRVLPRGDLAAAVRDETLDFVIGEADFIAQSQTENNLRILASIWPSEAQDAGSAASTVFFTRAASLEAQSLSQFGDMPVAAAFADSFQGYYIALYELSRRGYDSGFMTELYFTGPPYDNVVHDVLSGKAGAGILPACVLEEMEQEGRVKMEDFRIINPRRPAELRCAHSADVFPSVSVASMARTPPAMRKTMVIALLGVSGGKGLSQWALPASMQSVLDVFYTLQIGPYRFLSRWSIRRFLQENSGVVAVIVILTLMILSYAAVLQFMVRQRTGDLRKAWAERERIEQEFTASRERISALERTGIIGQMSSMIAHELKQPLGAINNFGNGLLRRVKRGSVDHAVLEDALQEIVGQGRRAAEIVDKVRSYAKHPDPVMSVCDLKDVLEKSLSEFRHSNRDAPPISLYCQPRSWVEADSWEIQLAVINLLKNAAEALQKTPMPHIDVVVVRQEGMWHLSVVDNGEEITQEKADLFFEPLNSGKISGMGLGLSIVANVAERHNGHAFARPNIHDGHGCVMTIVMPVAPEPQEVTGNGA